MNFTQASVRNVGTHGLMLREDIKRKNRKIRVPMQSWGADWAVVAEKFL